jgi:hypothetical protein
MHRRRGPGGPKVWASAVPKNADSARALHLKVTRCIFLTNQDHPAILLLLALFLFPTTIMMTLRSAPHHTIFARRSLRNNKKTEVDSFDPFVTLKFRLVNMINVIQEAVLSEDEEESKCDIPLINGKMVNVVASSSTTTATTSTSRPGMMAPELAEYYRLCLSPHGRQNIQQWFDVEYNTAAKAAELQTYYAHRLNLGQYTIDTEVPRLDYTVVYRCHVVTSSSTTDQKYRVQQMFREAMASSTTTATSTTTPTTATSSGRHDPTTARALCIRCANQSLLADVLEVLTGRDRWIRPQLGMTAVAKTCHFYVDLDAAVVQVSATLELSSSSLAMMMAPAMTDSTTNMSSHDQTNGGAGRRCQVAEMEVVVKWTAAVVNCTVVDIRLL